VRYLAIDPGDKRTGLAVGDDTSGIASPFDVIVTASAQHRLSRIGDVLAQEQPDAVVVGLPLNMDGSEGAPAKQARLLAQTITQQFGVTTHMMDERLTSHVADQQMAGHGLTRGQKKARRDALAAAAILHDFFAWQNDQDNRP